MDSLYLKSLRKRRIRPNFWCSEQYFEAKGWKEAKAGDWIWVEDSDQEVMLPPIAWLNRVGMLPEWWEGREIWSDFPNVCMKGMFPEKLDLEYIYDPKEFKIMKGKEWAVFRKNCRKWPRRNPDHKFAITKDRIDCKEVLVRWLENLDSSAHVYDFEMMEYYLSADGIPKIVIRNKEHIVGAAAWDYNFEYTNFRYCISDPEEHFLNEYLRMMFYDENDDRLVNDGGVLDNPHLKLFKDKLNPMGVRQVYSWKSEGK